MTEQNIKQNRPFLSKCIINYSAPNELGKTNLNRNRITRRENKLGNGDGPDDKGDNVIFYSQEVFATFKSPVEPKIF
jgi:hypothetical protein